MMPNYYYQIRKGSPVYTNPGARSKWLEKHEGEWITESDLPVLQGRKMKSKDQTGYYFGFLLPEILKQLIRDGITQTIKIGSRIEKDVRYNEKTAHELITELCGDVGEDGKHLRLSECDFREARFFIDNVLDFAIFDLNMNEKKLRAKKGGA